VTARVVWSEIGVLPENFDEIDHGNTEDRTGEAVVEACDQRRDVPPSEMPVKPIAELGCSARIQTSIA
jgi:hypothetical protein